jgi:Gluconate 2-dehydrogenase subunit 3
MKRRQALKAVFLSASGFIALPSWANNWNIATVSLHGPLLNTFQADILTDIVNTLIPEGDKPGAKSLGVPAFIQKMAADCFEPKAQEDFKTGLEDIDKIAQQTHNQSFINITNAQKEEILRGVSNDTETKQKAFFNTVKNLTIQGYLSSEYVMTNHYKYEMAPGHYYGCVAV